MRTIFVALSLSLSLGFPALAATPKDVQAGSIVNSWIQGGLRVTDQLFDLGIQGRGFFALKMPDGSNIYTRHGSFFLDKEGYLSHKALGGRLLVVDADDPTRTTPVPLGERLTRHAGAKSMRVNLDGTIEGVYADGWVRKLGWVKLAVFQNARMLRHSAGDHALFPTETSGEAFFGLPQTEVYGNVYSGTLEEVEEIYELSLD